MPKIRIFGDAPVVGRAEESWASGDYPRFARRHMRRNPTTAESMRDEQQSIWVELPDDKKIQILSPPAVARVLGCTPGRVIQLIQEKKLHAEQLGRTWLILRKALENYIASRGTEIQRRYALFLEGGDSGNPPDEKHGGRARRHTPKRNKGAPHVALRQL